MHEALGLFGQAALAYDAGAFPGTALLCRSALEAACYSFLTRRPMKGQEGSWGHDFSKVPHYPDGRPKKKIPFESLRVAIVPEGVLSPEQEKVLKRVKEDGDVIAHLFERSNMALQEPSTWQDIRLPGDYILWINQPRAFEDLRDTAGIFKTLADAMAQWER